MRVEVKMEFSLRVYLSQGAKRGYKTCHPSKGVEKLALIGD